MDLAALAPGTLVWYAGVDTWKGVPMECGQYTGVIVHISRDKRWCKLMPTPGGAQVTLVRVEADRVLKVIPWGGGRLRTSIKGWLRLVKTCATSNGCTKQGRTGIAVVATVVDRMNARY